MKREAAPDRSVWNRLKESRQAWSRGLSAYAGRIALSLVIFFFLLAAVLSLPRRPTFVDLVLRLDEVVLELRIDKEGYPRPLLGSDLRILEAAWRNVRSAASPGVQPCESGSDDGDLRIRSDKRLRLDVLVRDGTRVEAQFVSGDLVSIRLDAKNWKDVDGQQNSPFRAEVPYDEELRILSAETFLPARWCELVRNAPALGLLPPLRLEASGPDPRLTLKLQRPSPTKRIDAHGIDAGNDSWEVPDGAERVVIDGRVIYLDEHPSRARDLLNTRNGLLAREVELWDSWSGAHGAQSFVRGGRILFPNGEREAIDLPPWSYVDLEPEGPLVVRSLHVRREAFELHLAGTLRTLRLGGSEDARRELVPTYLRWAFANEDLRWFIGSLGGAAVLLAAAWVQGRTARDAAR